MPKKILCYYTTLWFSYCITKSIASSLKSSLEKLEGFSEYSWELRIFYVPLIRKRRRKLTRERCSYLLDEYKEAGSTKISDYESSDDETKWISSNLKNDEYKICILKDKNKCGTLSQLVIQ